MIYIIIYILLGVFIVQGYLEDKPDTNEVIIISTLLVLFWPLYIIYDSIYNT